MRTPRRLPCFVFSIGLGLLSLGTQAAFADQEVSKGKDATAPPTKQALPQADSARTPSSSPADMQKVMDADSSKAAAKDDKDDKNPKKKEGCRPGSLLLMGVGC